MAARALWRSPGFPFPRCLSDDALTPRSGTITPADLSSPTALGIHPMPT